MPALMIPYDTIHRVGLSTYAVYGRRSHKMKQTQTHVWSLAGEEAVSYSLARGKAAAVTRESGEVAAYSLARAVSCTWARAVPRRDSTEGKHRNRC